MPTPWTSRFGEQLEDFPAGATAGGASVTEMRPSLTTESFPEPASTTVADCVPVMLMLAPVRMLMLSLPDLATRPSVWSPLHTMVSPCEVLAGAQAARADPTSASAIKVRTQSARRRKPLRSTRFDASGGDGRSIRAFLPMLPPLTRMRRTRALATYTTLNRESATSDAPRYDSGITRAPTDSRRRSRS